MVAVVENEFMSKTSIKSTKNFKQANLRIPPQSIESEQAVLGSIMLRKDAMHEVEDMVSAESFYV